MKSSIFLRQATIHDVEGILKLLNRCYHDDMGWTNAAHLMANARTTHESLLGMIEDDSQYVFIYPETVQVSETLESLHDNVIEKGLQVETGQIMACICVAMNKATQTAHIAIFSVHPGIQGQGVGSEILTAAETFVYRHLQPMANKHGLHHVLLTMDILEQRPKLLAYYQRRGFSLNEDDMSYITLPKCARPRQKKLKLLRLEKNLEYV